MELLKLEIVDSYLKPLDVGEAERRLKKMIPGIQSVDPRRG